MSDASTSDDSVEEAADHVEATVQTMADLHAEAARQTPPIQRTVTQLTVVLARPVVLAAALGLLLGWMGYNSLAQRLGLFVFDPPPFALLELAATVAAFVTTLLILATQRREEELARRRAQLTLQLAALSEQKIAKVISILEEQRRENPFLPTRHDPEAEELARSADPRRVLDRIIETHESSDPASPGPARVEGASA